jgi:GT-D fold-like domain
MIIDALMVPAIHSGEADRIEPLLGQLTDREISALSPTTIMGLTRLFLENGYARASENLILRSVGRRSHRLLYFLEPLVELDRMGALTEAPLLEFCAQFRPPSSLLVLDWLSRRYKPADEADERNFQRFIIAPLRALSQNAENLMDIRFSAEQRAALQAEIRTHLADGRPLSLLRLGDGEAFPYPAPEADGIAASVFEQDNENFERSYLGLNRSPTADQAREKLIRDFCQAVARCDILGFPSVFRIVRNLGTPYTRYGARRNQRAFLRILGALGTEIPLGQKIFTEERCHRIRGAIDEPFVLDLAAQARSVVLVSSWSEIQAKIPVKSLLITVPSKKRVLYKIYPEVIERIYEASGPGTLVLIGAGLPAKVMADQARQSGAVALDVGALMDYMVGHKTRTIADLT